MRAFCLRLLEAVLPVDVAGQVVGDLTEQQHRGTLWIVRETVAAIWFLRRPRHRGDGRIMRLMSEFRIAARLLRRAPGFAAVAILTLALAIGATTAIYSVVEPVLLRPLPYPDPDRLAFVWERERDGSRDNVGFATIRDLGTGARTVERWAAIGSWLPTLSGNGDPERVTGDRVSWTYFRTLGVQPALGRDFLPGEDAPGNNQVVILSDGLWRRRFGGDSGIVGHPIAIDGNPVTVVGVMPASFDNVVSPDAVIWRVLGYRDQPWTCRTCHHLRMVVRVRPGATVTAAAAELDAMFARLVREYPKDYPSIGASVVPLQLEATREYRPALVAIGLAVVLVLLIAVANVVNLQLARAVRREQEFAIRVALGAGQLRLATQLLCEGLLLAALGGVAGLAVARLTLPVLVSRLPAGIPRLAAIHLDATALALVGGIVTVLAVVMALAPARRGQQDLGAALRSGRRLAGGLHGATRAGLVVGEVALAMMLLVSAALVARSLLRLLTVRIGFDATHLLSMEINAVGPRYADDVTIYQYHRRVLDAVGQLPGVAEVAIANQIPLGGNLDMYGVWDADHPPSRPEQVPSGDRYVVSSRYLHAMRIPILSGRAFTEADAADTAVKVALVSAALGQKLWPGQSPIGKRMKMGSPSDPPRTIIGVTGDVKHRALDAGITQQWYIPEGQWRQGADNQAVVVVRTHGDPAALAATVRRAIAAIDPTQPIVHVATMDQLIAASTTQRRLALVLFAAFAAAALLLAVTGIYGVLAGSVSERTREIGVRSALGATPAQIVAAIMGQGARLAALGVVLGLVGAVGLTRYLRALLFGIQPNDPATLAGVVVLIAVVTTAGCLIPAMRAARVDPSRALRSE